MRKISFQKDIGITALYQLITSHVIHGFFYTAISRNVFALLAIDDKSLNVVDMNEYGMGYVWYSHNNLIHIIIDDTLKDNELIYLSEEDVVLMVRNKKINSIKENIN